MSKPAPTGVEGDELAKLRATIADLSAKLAATTKEEPWVQITSVPLPPAAGAAAAPADTGRAAGDTKKCPEDSKALVAVKAYAARKTAAARMGLKRGLKPTRVTMPYSFQITCNVAGVISSTLLISPDLNALEWGAFQALYDEYKVHGGAARFMLPYVTNVPTASGGLNVDSMGFVIGYDPTDPNSLTSVREGCELGQHKLLAASPVFAAAGGSAATYFGFRSANSEPFRFDWTTKGIKELAISSTGVLNYTPGAWKGLNASGSNNPDGQLKTFGSASFTAVAICCTGINYIDVEFRSRK